jgi:hypothetical protein
MRAGILENLAVKICHLTYSSVLITGLVIQRLKLFHRQYLTGNKNCDFINGYSITKEVYSTFNILNITFMGGTKFNMCRL